MGGNGGCIYYIIVTEETDAFQHADQSVRAIFD